MVPCVGIGNSVNIYGAIEQYKALKITIIAIT